MSITTESMNKNNILNVSNGDADDALSEDQVGEHNLEAYTVVLSAAAHVLSMLFGGGSSIAVVIAICARRNINKYSYTLVLTLFMVCCCLNFVWSPLEIADLIMYHYFRRHPCRDFVIIKSSIYIFLLLVISFLIALLSAEGMVRMKNCFTRVLRRLWPLLSCTLAVLSGAFLAVVFYIRGIQSRNKSYDGRFYFIHEVDTHSIFLALVTVAFCVVFVALLVLAVLLIKEAMYWEDGRPHLRQKKMKLTIPEFLISQSNACADNEGGFEHSTTPSPSSPKLLTVGDPDTASIKAEDGSSISELPAPQPPKPMGNRLGINMAQVLGRRRHTICQISDSTTSTTPADPISKAKQYNYVRKFSVDISALQAQLQNPKIFKEAPFQSDIDLAKKQNAEGSKSAAPKPLLPLKPLPMKFDEKEEKPETGKSETEFNSGLAIPPPPVIMVSNDDAQSNYGDNKDIPNDIRGSKESFQKPSKAPNANCNAAQKPTSLSIKDPMPTEEHISAPTLESATSDLSDTESEGHKMARLTLLLCLTFVLNVLPLFVTVVLHNTLSSHAYINICTCTLAVSAIQTIVYPHLIACSDDVVHRAVQKLKRRVKHMCSCRSDNDMHSQVEDSSSTSQV